MHPNNDDIIIIPENEYCASERMTIFVGSIYAYKGLLMVNLTLYYQVVVLTERILDFRSLFGLGNTPRFDSSLERQQTRWAVSLQRRHHVYLWRSRCFGPRRSPGRNVPHHR